jgi:hypothetical protein
MPIRDIAARRAYELLWRQKNRDKIRKQREVFKSVVSASDHIDPRPPGWAPERTPVECKVCCDLPNRRASVCRGCNKPWQPDHYVRGEFVDSDRQSA